MRSSVRAVATATLIAAPTALAFFSGGFFDQPRLIAGAAAWAMVVLVALVVPRPLPSSNAGRLALAGLSLLTVWTALSLTWAPLGGRAQDDLQRLLLYLGFFIAAVALLRGPGVRRWLEPSLVLGALVVVGFGLSERVLPGLIELDRSRSASGRLEQPITYWNAFGALAAFGLVLAVRVAGDAQRGRTLRAAAAAAGIPLGLATYLSFSRGALAATAAGLLVVLALAPTGREQLRSAVAVIGAAAIAALVSTQFPTIESLPPGKPGDAADGFQMLVVLLVLAAAAAVVVNRRSRGAPRRLPLPVSRRAAVLTVATVVLLAAVVAASTLEGTPQGVSPDPGTTASRLGSIDTTRYRYWEVAFDAWADRPLIGLGSGGFFVEWRRQQDRDEQSGDAHSLYVETAAELGVVGLAFLLLFLGAVVACAVRLYRLNPGAATGLAAGFAAWAVHAGLDWDLEMPAVTLPALLLAVAIVAWSEEEPSPATPEATDKARKRHHDLMRIAG